jgi:hypothetical protein
VLGYRRVDGVVVHVRDAISALVKGTQTMVDLPRVIWTRSPSLPAPEDTMLTLNDINVLVTGRYDQEVIITAPGHDVAVLRLDNVPNYREGMAPDAALDAIAAELREEATAKLRRAELVEAAARKLRALAPRRYTTQPAGQQTRILSNGLDTTAMCYDPSDAELIASLLNEHEAAKKA